MYEGMRQPFAVYQMVDKRVVTLALSDGLLRLFGYTDRALAMRELNDAMFRSIHPDDADRLWQAILHFEERGELNVIYRTKDRISNDYRVLHAQGVRVPQEDADAILGHVWYMDEGIFDEERVGVGAQMTQTLKNALHEESILKATRYDKLTGLPNLAYFFELAHRAKVDIQKSGEQAVLLYMDLNGMKYYNQQQGFEEGDRLLVALAKLLEKAFGRECCCHVGADRFAAFAGETGVLERLDRFFEAAGKINNGRTLPLRVGVYSSALEDVPVGAAYDRSKMACDAVRKSDVSSFLFYNADMRDQIRRRRYVQTHINQAIKNKWIQVYYQPIVRAVNARVCDEEALARWIEPDKGVLSPGEFIPYLESGGLIYKLDLYVLDQVLEKIRRQREIGLEVVPHSINLSRADFDACDIVDEVRKRVDAAGVDRSLITIEITESTIGRDFDFMKGQIDRFRNLGFPVWMDDFGSGYSSLDVLQSIQFDLIKFDMSFLRKLDEGDGGKIILTELMKMATSLKLDTVCEGVETEAQARFLQEAGCSKLQGYYFCRPIPFEQIVERYRKGIQIGFENPEESAYFETIGRINLYDLGVIANEEADILHHTFNTLPMGIIEIKDSSSRFVRSNQSYREFMQRFFGLDMSRLGKDFVKYDEPFMSRVAETCCEHGARAFLDETMADGSVVHSFARRIGTNPVTGDMAIAIAVLSIS